MVSREGAAKAEKRGADRDRLSAASAGVTGASPTSPAGKPSSELRMTIKESNLTLFMTITVNSTQTNRFLEMVFIQQFSPQLKISSRD
jgi:hypothetical protein